MLEILFTEGAAGSMQVAKSLNLDVIPSTFAVFREPNGTLPAPEELARKQAQVEEEYRKKHENAVPVEGDSRDVVCFPLKLSMGDISEPFSDKRADFLQSMVLIDGEEFAGIGRELMATARSSLEKIRNASEPVRIWTSRNPDELCGFCHILTCLPEDADIRVVEMPEYEVMKNEVRTYSNWNEFEPTELGRFQALERPLTDTERRYFAGLWRELQTENGPLRAVVNGKICTVGEDFYDWLILRELENQPQEFHEARLIGQILGKYPLGLGDFQIAMRIEELISRGMLTPATEPEVNEPIYHRYLKKGSENGTFLSGTRTVL